MTEIRTHEMQRPLKNGNNADKLQDIQEKKIIVAYIPHFKKAIKTTSHETVETVTCSKLFERKTSQAIRTRFSTHKSWREHENHNASMINYIKTPTNNRENVKMRLRMKCGAGCDF